MNGAPQLGDPQPRDGRVDLLRVVPISSAAGCAISCSTADHDEADAIASQVACTPEPHRVVAPAGAVQPGRGAVVP